MLIGITPGRALSWSPRWMPAEHSVLFDASSGDYWVLAETTRQLLEALQHSGPMPVDELGTRWGHAEENDELLAELSRAGLLVGWVDGQAVGLAVFLGAAA